MRLRGGIREEGARFALPDTRGGRRHMSGESQNRKLKSKATGKSVRPTQACYLLLTTKFTVLG